MEHKLPIENCCICLMKSPVLILQPVLYYGVTRIGGYALHHTILPFYCAILFYMSLPNYFSCKGFQQLYLYIMLRIIRFLHFVHHLVFWREHNISETGSVSTFMGHLECRYPVSETLCFVQLHTKPKKQSSRVLRYFITAI